MPNQHDGDVPAASTSGITRADVYVCSEDNDNIFPNPRSPTPPNQAQTMETASNVKKGIGKSTIKRSNPSATPTPAKKKSPGKVKPNTASASRTEKKETQISESSYASAMEKERLNVLKELSDNLKKDDEEDEYYHWSMSLGRKIKRVPYARLQEKAVAHINSVMSDAVLGEEHPALSGAVTHPAFQLTQQMPSMSYTLPIQHQPQTQYYLTPPNMYQAAQSQAVGTSGVNSTGLSSCTPTSTGQNVQADAPPTSSTPIQHNRMPFNPSIQQSHQMSQSQIYSQLNTNDLSRLLSNSPMKVMPPTRCHTINNFGPTPSSQAALEFANL